MVGYCYNNECAKKVIRLIGMRMTTKIVRSIVGFPNFMSIHTDFLLCALNRSNSYKGDPVCVQCIPKH